MRFTNSPPKVYKIVSLLQFRAAGEFSQYSRDLFREYLPVLLKDKHQHVLILASKINENKTISSKIKDVRESFG